MPNSVSDRAVISEETSPAGENEDSVMIRKDRWQQGLDEVVRLSATWSRHRLKDIDGAVDQFLLDGVNLFCAKSVSCHP